MAPAPERDARAGTLLFLYGNTLLQVHTANTFIPSFEAACIEKNGCQLEEALSTRIASDIFQSTILGSTILAMTSQR